MFIAFTRKERENTNIDKKKEKRGESKRERAHKIRRKRSVQSLLTISREYVGLYYIIYKTIVAENTTPLHKICIHKMSC